MMLYAGLALFFGLHFYSAYRSRDSEQDIKQRLGDARYMGSYALVSIAGLGFIVWGYKQAPITPFLFDGIAIARPAIFVLMLVGFVLLFASQLPPGHIKKTLKHPMLLGVCLWAMAHLLDGANWKQFLLFGSFLVYSVVAMIAIGSRRIDGEAKPAKAASIKFDIFAILIGAAIYFVTIKWLHAGLENYF